MKISTIHSTDGRELKCPTNEPVACHILVQAAHLLVLRQDLVLVGATAAAGVEARATGLKGIPAPLKEAPRSARRSSLPTPACGAHRRLAGVDLLARRTARLRRRWAVAVADDDDVDADDLQVPPTSPPSSEEWLGESDCGRAARSRRASPSAAPRALPDELLFRRASLWLDTARVAGPS